MKVFFAIGLVLFMFGCGDLNDENNVVSYRIVKETENLNFSKANVDVRLSKKVSEEELAKLAHLLRKDRKNFANLWIAYYQPGQQLGSGAWATTHFTPELEVKILGLTADEEEKMVNTAKSTSRDVVGIWLDDRPLVGNTVTIYRENQRLYLESRHKDGSGSTDEMTESQLNSATKLVEKSGNPHGEYFVLDKNGQLQAGGNDGIFLKYKKIK
ncbi:hypothetical protein LO977_003225 [Vibrio metschnikovii]|nr:hypothetical protein [Vibrio metschnikovii]